MVDELRVERLLRRLTDTTAYLKAERHAGAGEGPRRRWLDGIKYNVIAAVELAVDVGQHLCAAEGWGPPADNSDVFAILADRGVLTTELGTAMARANGFRNVLVHEYVAVDDDLVVANLAHLEDLDRFVAAVAEWLLRSGST